MSWWQFSLNCQASELEQVEELMQDLGALSLSLADAGDEPIYEPLPGTTPVWRQSIVTATFDAANSAEVLYQQISSALPSHLVSSLRQHSLQEQDWEQAYRQAGRSLPILTRLSSSSTPGSLSAPAATPLPPSAWAGWRPMAPRACV
jgi:ribosomal protein L11 methyltransferase